MATITPTLPGFGEDLEGLLQFVQFTNRFRQIERTIHYADVDTPERNGEHAFQLALVCWFVNARLEVGLDECRLMRIALVHDLVETYAGDTPAFADTDGCITGSTLNRKDKKQREQAALERIHAEWNDAFPEMLTFLRAYEDRDVKKVDLSMRWTNYFPSSTYIKTVVAHGICSRSAARSIWPTRHHAAPNMRPSINFSRSCEYCLKLIRCCSQP